MRGHLDESAYNCLDSLMDTRNALPDLGLTPDEERACAAWAKEYFSNGCNLEPNLDGTAVVVTGPDRRVLVTRPISDFKARRSESS